MWGPWQFWRPRLDWIQVEVTSRCQAQCVYCPHTAWSSGWLNGDLDSEVFDAVLEQLPKGTMVHLQGWGEPLLYPGLGALVRRAAESGFPVTTTTNGVLLHVDRALELAEAGLEILGVSLVGTDPHLNGRFRRGTSIQHLLKTTESIAGELVRRNLDRPRVHAAYLLPRSGIEGLASSVRDLISAGVNAIVVSSLDLVPAEGLTKETLWDPDDGEREFLDEAVQNAETAAGEHGVELVFQLATSSRRRVCSEGPDRSVFIGFDGAVFPCVYTGVPTAGEVSHWTPWGAAPFRRMPMGRLEESDVKKILKEPQARAFRRAARGARGVPPRCRQCVKPLVERWKAGSGGDSSLVPELG